MNKTTSSTIVGLENDVVTTYFYGMIRLNRERAEDQRAALVSEFKKAGIYNALKNRVVGIGIF